MTKAEQLRENTRKLEISLANINRTECCCGGISTAQCYMLVEIGRAPGISGKELSAVLHMDKSSVSRIAEELVRRKLAERRESKTDRRRQELYLLPKGYERFMAIENDMNEKFLHILQAIPQDKRDAVIDMLEIYNEACKAAENREE